MESRRASAEQFSTLLEFMESHGDLSRPQPGLQGRLRADQLWQELASLLNSIGSGVNKPPEKWKKVWADWKSKTKKKSLTIRQYAGGTGGGPNSRLTLTRLETRVLALMGALAVEGHPEIEEQGFDTPLAAPSHAEMHALDDHQYDMVTIMAEPLSPTPSSNEQLPSQPLPPPPPPTLLPHHPSTSQPLPVATPTRRPTPRPITPGSVPQEPLEETPVASPVAGSQRRPRSTRRRRTQQTPFDRAASEFVAVELRRLQLEERREDNETRRIEVEEMRVRNEARRIEVDERRTDVLSRFANIAETFLQHYLQSRDQPQ